MRLGLGKPLLAVYPDLDVSVLSDGDRAHHQSPGLEHLFQHLSRR